MIYSFVILSLCSPSGSYTIRNLDRLVRVQLLDWEEWLTAGDVSLPRGGRVDTPRRLGGPSVRSRGEYWAKIVLAPRTY